MSANAEFIDVWNEILVPKFKRFRHVFVVGAAKHSDPALAKHGPARGSRVLDVGCGFGETSLALARLVGERGSVVGFDCCEPMLEVGRSDARAAGIENASFVCGDAQTHTFDQPFDYVFARFGTMFFGAPKAAMRNLRKATAPGARLCNIVWRPIEDNPWLGIPKQIALRHLPPPPDDGKKCGPGPFSMSDPEVVRAILEGAGWTDVAFEHEDIDILVGRNLEEAIDLQLELGPAGEIVREASERGIDRRADVEADLRAAMTPYLGPTGLIMRSSSWRITARNPG
jgi:ubiquinone/menaquinone biosynthesis C-methylase UbiE